MKKEVVATMGYIRMRASEVIKNEGGEVKIDGNYIVFKEVLREAAIVDVLKKESIERLKGMLMDVHSNMRCSEVDSAASKDLYIALEYVRSLQGFGKEEKESNKSVIVQKQIRVGEIKNEWLEMYRDKAGIELSKYRKFRDIINRRDTLLWDIGEDSREGLEKYCKIILKEIRDAENRVEFGGYEEDITDILNIEMDKYMSERERVDDTESKYRLNCIEEEFGEFSEEMDKAKERDSEVRKARIKEYIGIKPRKIDGIIGLPEGFEGNSEKMTKAKERAVCDIIVDQLKAIDDDIMSNVSKELRKWYLA